MKLSAYPVDKGDCHIGIELSTSGEFNYIDLEFHFLFWTVSFYWTPWNND